MNGPLQGELDVTVGDGHLLFSGDHCSVTLTDAVRSLFVADEIRSKQ